MALLDLAVVNAKILLEHRIVDRDIVVKEGKIASIVGRGGAPKGCEEVDVKGNLVLPGLIDVHTHLRDLHLEYKEDLYSGTCAALTGGFTTVLDMPNTLPATDSPQRLSERMELAEKRIVADVGFYSCVPRRREEFEGLNDLGAIGFKVFLHNPLTGLDVNDDDALRRVLESISEVDAILAVHAEDGCLIKELEEKLDEGTRSPFTHSRTHPPLAEVKAVKRLLSLIKGINPRLHFCHISTGRASSLICKAKSDGYRVTYEVTPHHLLLSEELLSRIAGLALVDPPLRGHGERCRLWSDLLHGRVDIVASDHAPHALDEKRSEDFRMVPSGFPGLETTLPLLLTEFKEGRLPLSLLTRALAGNPAKIFRLGGKGSLSPGFDADLTVVDLDEEFIIEASRFQSKAKYSPFEGRRVTGKPVQVFLGGRLVMEGGEVLSKPGSGRVLRPDK